MNFKLKATMTDLLFYGKNNEINNKSFFVTTHFIDIKVKFFYG